MKVLSLFDGISCGMLALNRAGIVVDTYYSSEIDRYAIEVSRKNYPNIVRLGDVTSWDKWDIDWGSIDLILAGSPCQSISGLGDNSGLSGKSGLFYTFFDILQNTQKYNPDVKFILENVSGKKEALDEITKFIGVEPAVINSNIFSAQNRKRLYWTNIQYQDIPETPMYKLKDVLEMGVPEDAILSPGRMKWILSDKGRQCLDKRYATLDGERASCLTARSDASWNSNYVTREGQVTRLTPIEYERLQTIPDNYTKGVSNSQRYKMLGNGWTVSAIAHILRGLVEGDADES